MGRIFGNDSQAVLQPQGQQTGGGRIFGNSGRTGGGRISSQQTQTPTTGGRIFGSTQQPTTSKHRKKEEDGGLIARIGGATGVDFSKEAGEKGTSVWTPLDYLLNGLVYGYAGSLESGFKKAKNIKKRKDAGENVPLLEQLTAPSPFNPSNWSGGGENLQTKNRKTTFDVVRQEMPGNDLAAATGFLADLAMPTPGGVIGKTGQVTKLDKVAKAGTGKLVKATKLDKAAAKVQSATDPVLKYRGGQPKEYAERAEQALRESRQGQLKAQEVGDLLSKDLTHSEQLRIGQIMKGGLTSSKTDAKLVDRANQARKIIDDLSKELVDEAMVGAERQLTPKGLAAELVNTLAKTFKKPDPSLGQTEKGWRTADELARELLDVFYRNQPAHAGGMVTKLVKQPDGTEKAVRTFADVGADVRGKVTKAKGGDEVVKNAFNPEDAIVGIPRVERVTGTTPPTAFTQTGEGFVPVEGGVGVKKGVNVDGLPQKSEPRPHVEPEYYYKPPTQGGIKISDRTVRVIQENMGKYLPRLYKQYETNPEGFVKFLGGKQAKIIRDRLMKKKDLSDDARKSLGEIMEPAYPAAKGVAQVTDMIAKSKFLRWVNDNFASTDNLSGNLTLIPDSPGYGMLAGKYVPKEIADDLAGIVQPKQRGTFQKVYEDLLSKWKTGKVVMNPAAVARNQMTNMVSMSILGDMPSYEVVNPMRWVDAAKDIKNQTAFYKLLQKDTDLITDTMYGNEIAKFLDDIEIQPGTGPQKLMQAIKKAPGDVYSTIEQVSKIVLTKYWIENGKSLKEAADIAEYALFNYRKVPKVVDNLRKFPLGFPFITYAYFAIPRYAQQVVKDPKKIAQLSRTGQNVEAEAKYRLGPASKEQLPDFMKGQYLRLPFQEKGQDLYLDLNYILPWGSLNTVSLPDKPFGTFLGEPQNPAYTLMADLFRNKSSFTDKEIWSETDSDSVKAQKFADYVYKALLPTLTPGIPGTEIKGGWSAQKLWDSGLFGNQQRPDTFGRLRDVPTVLLDVFLGLKATPIDYQETKAIKTGKKKQEIQKIETEMRAIQRNQKLFPEEKKKQLQQKQEDLKRTRDSIQELR